MRPGQLLRHSGKQLYHPEIDVHSPFNHQQKPHATCREDEIGTFAEAGACGTAAVISPIARIDDLDEDKSYIFSKDGKPGPICEKLYNKLRAIQYGDEPDTHKWITIVE